MNLEEVKSVLKYWIEFNCPKSICQTNVNERKSLCPSCTFASLGQHLLRHAISRNETLLTVQVGAMDGKSNDPMYEMFVTQGTSSLFSNLTHWLPVMIEPVPHNYAKMMDTYVEMAYTKGLGCAVPIYAAVSYDPDKTECPFCRFNTNEDSPEKCKSHPDWMRFQIGTLDCEYSKQFFQENFELCILQDPLPRSSVAILLDKHYIPSDNIAMVQIDIEGYEAVFLPNFLRDIRDSSMLPPIIHFEQKVMRELDVKRHKFDGGNKTRIDIVEALMAEMGYIIFDDGEDWLALRA